MTKIYCALLLNLVFVVSYFEASGQSLVYCDSMNVPPTNFEQTSIGQLNINDCFDSTMQVFATPKTNFDIVINTDGNYFGFGILQGFYDTLLIWYNYSDILNEFLTVIGAPGFPNFGFVFPDKHFVQGLSGDEAENVYAAGHGITKVSSDYFPSAYYTERYLGDLPPNMYCLGDITYRDGRFYMASIANQLVEVNMKNPAKSKVVMDFPSGMLPVHGLATVQIDCDSFVTYAIGKAPGYSKVYEIDFDNWTVTEVCEVPKTITGASSRNECSLPLCEVFMDLDSNNSSLAFRGNYCADAICIPPVAIADADVAIYSTSGNLDSVSLLLYQVLNPGQEYLLASLFNNLQIVGNGSAQLMLVNDGNTSLQDFIDAIESIQYFNDAVNITYGIRKVAVQAWSNGISSRLSFSELPIDNNALKLNAHLTEPLCHGNLNGSISVSTEGGVPPYNYVWQSGQTDTIISGLGAGNYILNITDAAGCNNPDTVILDEPEALMSSISYLGPLDLCNNSGQLLATASGGVGDYNFDWGNGLITELISQIGPGDYAVVVTDSNNCQITTGYSIPEGDSILLIETQFTCEGVGYSWKGNTYFQDTTVCEVTQLLSGCDSTICLKLMVYLLPQLSLETTGDFCNSNEVAISAGNHPTYLWSNGANTSNISVSAPGNYQVTVTNSFGCEKIDTIQIPEGISFQHSEKAPSCFGLNDGVIEIYSVQGGVSPYNYILNDVNNSIDGNFSGLSSGDYLISVEDMNGCREEIPVSLEVPLSFFVDAGPDSEIGLGDAVALHANTNLLNPAISWQPSTWLDCTDCLTPLARPLETISYKIAITDTSGCVATDEVTISVDTKSHYYIPTAFSPNNDGINDHLCLYSDASVEAVLSFKVFNRWGDVVFDSGSVLPNVPASGWDGRFKGKDAEAGVYVFHAELLRADGTVDMASGEVVLLR